MIEASNLYKRFGDIEAVHGVSLRVAPGEIFGLLGSCSPRDACAGRSFGEAVGLQPECGGLRSQAVGGRR